MEEKQPLKLMTKNSYGSSYVGSPNASPQQSKLRLSQISVDQHCSPKKSNLNYIKRSENQFLNVSPTAMDSVSVTASFDKMGATWGSRPSANFMPLESERI